MNSTKIVLTTAQILEAHAAHGNDFIVINFDSIRKYKDYSQYLEVGIKLVDGSNVGIRYWKLSNDGLIVGSRIRKPDQRKYESIRMGISLIDDEGIENENAKALQLLCIAYEEKMKQFKNDNIITDDARAPRKQSDGSYKPVYLINTKIVSPMQTTANDKQKDEIIDLENPFFWLSLPKKKFFTNGEVAKKSIHFDDKYYADENGQPNVEKPVMTYEFAPKFYNVADFYHHPRSGKKIYKRLGAVDPETNENYVDNTNVQDYITKGSAIMGNLKFEITVSGRQCKLDISLNGTIWVKAAEQTEGGNSGENEDDIDAFTNRYASIGSSQKQSSEEDMEGEIDDYADEE